MVKLRYSTNKSASVFFLSKNPSLLPWLQVVLLELRVPTLFRYLNDELQLRRDADSCPTTQEILFLL